MADMTYDSLCNAIMDIYTNMNEDSQYDDFDNQFGVIALLVDRFGFADMYDELCKEIYIAKGALWDCFDEIEAFKNAVCNTHEDLMCV